VGSSDLVGRCKKEDLNYFATRLPTKREGKEEKEVGQGQRNIIGDIADKCEDNGVRDETDRRIVGEGGRSRKLAV